VNIIVEQAAAGDLEARDFVVLGRMHRQFMTGSLVNWFGDGYVSSLYCYLAKSNHESLFTARLDGRIIGACVLSDQPTSLSRRMLLNTPMLLYAPVAVLRLPVARLLATALTARVRRKSLPAAELRHIEEFSRLPEVVWIYVDVDGRGRGVGRNLLLAAEADLKTRNQYRYIIHTSVENNSAVIQFYQRQAFTTRRQLLHRGAEVLLMEKQINVD
jgi:ribosomal protein S18 acetylase RimI-like enzyme